MTGSWRGRLLASAVALGVAVAGGALASGQKPDAWGEVLDQHPSIQYATRPTTDRVGKLGQALAHGARTLQRDARSGYLLSALEALNVPAGSQVLVFSKTGVQAAYTSPQNPRALYFDESVAVGYVPGAPVLEFAAHDPQQGVVFYTIDQTAATPVLSRRTSCLACHVSATTLNVPGLIARSHTVGEDGTVLLQVGPTNDVNHTTPHTERWGGYFVTSEGAAAPYAQRGHLGNITFSERGNTTNGAFIDWLYGSPESRAYPLPTSDIVSLLMFDHQTHAINLMTRLNWESRVASNLHSAFSADQASALQASSVRANASDATVRGLANELAEYLLFTREAPLPVPLIPRPGFAEYLAARTPQDRRGRSFGQLDLENRLLRYPCSYLVYSEAFDGLAPALKDAVYHRMVELLSGVHAPADYARVSADDRRAVLEILRATKPDFPGHDRADVTR